MTLRSNRTPLLVRRKHTGNKTSCEKKNGKQSRSAGNFTVGRVDARALVVVPDGGRRFATVATEQIALVNVSVAVNHEVANGIEIARLQVAQVAVVEAGVVVAH